MTGEICVSVSHLPSLKTLVGAALASALLSVCAIGSAYLRSCIPQPEWFGYATEPTQANSAVWRGHFNATQLAQPLETSLASNPDFAQARVRGEQAQVRFRHAGADRQPISNIVVQDAGRHVSLESLQGWVCWDRPFERSCDYYEVGMGGLLRTGSVWSPAPAVGGRAGTSRPGVCREAWREEYRRGGKPTDRGHGAAMAAGCAPSLSLTGVLGLQFIRGFMPSDVTTLPCVFMKFMVRHTLSGVPTVQSACCCDCG